MLKVNGVRTSVVVDVTIINAVPKKVAKGWLHSTTVRTTDGVHLGMIERLTSAKHGGRDLAQWVVIGSRMIANGNLNDIVKARFE
jgi:hypothetical protein